jgi:hypothetical protein
LRDPRYNSFSHQHHSYLARGHYADQLETLYASFPKDRVSVVLSERLFSEPQKVEGEVLDFLGLPPVASRSYGRHNAGRYVEMPSALRRRLSDHFEGSNHRLAGMLDTDPPWS